MRERLFRAIPEAHIFHFNFDRMGDVVAGKRAKMNAAIGEATNILLQSVVPSPRSLRQIKITVKGQ
jgi:hypothetical protein